MATQGGRRSFDDIKEITPFAKFLSEKSGVPEKLAQAVCEDADEIIGWVPNGITTIKDGVVECNAGIDCSNADLNNYILLPRNSEDSAFRLYQSISIISVFPFLLSSFFFFSPVFSSFSLFLFLL